MTLSVGAHRAATPAISPGVEQSAGDVMASFLSALADVSPAVWVSAAAGGFLVGAATVALARTRGPREDMVSREIRESAERHRAADGGFIALWLSSLLCAVAGLVLVAFADDRGEALLGVCGAGVGVVGAVWDMVRRRKARV